MKAEDLFLLQVAQSLLVIRLGCVKGHENVFSIEVKIHVVAGWVIHERSSLSMNEELTVYRNCERQSWINLWWKTSMFGREEEGWQQC